MTTKRFTLPQGARFIRSGQRVIVWTPADALREKADIEKRKRERQRKR